MKAGIPAKKVDRFPRQHGVAPQKTVLLKNKYAEMMKEPDWHSSSLRTISKVVFVDTRDNHKKPLSMHFLGLSRFQRESQEYKYRLLPLHIFVLFLFVLIQKQTLNE